MPSAESPDDTALPPAAAVGELLRDLRQQLRSAITTRLAWQAAALIALAGWLALIVDRFFEPPYELRLGVVLALATSLGCWLLFVVLRRVRAQVSDRQILTLLHRNHPDEAALISTAIDVQGQPTATSNGQLTDAIVASANEAATRLAGVRLVRSPNTMATVGFAAMSLLAAAGFAFTQPELAACFTRRLALSEELWPRRVELIAEGFEWDPEARTWKRVAARGEPLDFTVTASVTGQHPLPQALWARDDLRRVTTALTRVGQPIVDGEKRQAFRQRIERLDRDRQITLRGGDGRLRLRLIAADRPSLTEMTVAVVPPSYLDTDTTGTSPATLAAIPEGSRLRLHARSTKPLAAITATSQKASSPLTTSLTASFDSASNHALIETRPLEEATVIAVSTEDVDGLASDPFKLSIEVEKDQPPTVVLALDGIGRAITRDARLPVVLTPDDDHALAKVQLLLRHDEREIAFDLPTPEQLPASVAAEADLLSLRSASGDRLSLDPGERLTLTARVTDRYDLTPRPPAESRSIDLEVVTSAELLARIGDAQRELRQTIEALLADVQRLDYELDLQLRRETTEDATDQGNWTAERLLDLRKATTGIAAAAERADGIRSQVVNNRLAQPALIDRLSRRVVSPMEQLIRDELATAKQSLQDESPRSLAAASEAVQDAARVLEQVAGSLETQQTYNEVVALLRGLIREQRRVNQRTERQEGENVRSLFD